MITKKYLIKWQYYRNNEYTQCKIIDKTSNLILAEGEAKKSPKDNHNKDKARKISLKDALKDRTNSVSKSGLFTKEERTEIWETYRDMPIKPRW